MKKNSKGITWTAAVLLCVGMCATRAFGLASEERDFFGLTALESSHPEINGTNFSFAVSDTEFDVTHPALGWVGPGTYSDHFSSMDPIDDLPSKNPRVWSAGNRNYATTSYGNLHFGGYFYSFNLPVDNNNTLSNNIWGFHGTSVAGTAGSGLPGPAGRSLGVAPRAKLVLASDSADFNLSAGQVPEGNTFKTVAINRSFTGSSALSSGAREKGALISVNAAGNSFNSTSLRKLQTYGVSPNIWSVRLLPEKGYDIIASGLSGVTSTKAYMSAYGSQRNQESIFTDYSISTIRSGGAMDSYASGTSFASPFTVGGSVLIQQAYAESHGGHWLRIDQISRIMKKSAKFVDDDNVGLRFPVADFEAAVNLAISYQGDPGFEPNFSTDFSDTNRVNSIDNVPHYINPKQFRAEFDYGESLKEYTAPLVTNGLLQFEGNVGTGEANIAIRNGWGDLGVVNLTYPGKKLVFLFDYDTNPGWIGGSTETYLGIKEMYGSQQFMDSGIVGDWDAIGRLAFRITSYQGSDNCLVEVLRCSEMPNTNSALWGRAATYTVPVWDSPLASATVTNLTLGNFPELSVEITATHMKLSRDGQQLFNVAHGLATAPLARSTPYIHFKNGNTDHKTRIDNFSVKTTTSSEPVVTVKTMRSEAIEGLQGHGPGAFGVFNISRTVNTNTALTVGYTVSGTATPGSDYATLPGSVTIPAGIASVDILVTPISDATIESSETVALQLSTGAGYSLGGEQSASLAIVDLTDADSDSLMNTNEDRNANGILTDDDTDRDMLPDYADNDDDGDNVPTLDEDVNGNGSVLDDDSDTDAAPDYLDADDDGDGVPTREEDRNGNGNPQDDDFDNDGTPDYLDPDPSWFSDYYSMSVAGTFNDWNVFSNAMHLIGNGRWEAILSFDGVSGAEFKFAGNGAWFYNWGDNNQTDTDIPISDAADAGGGNVIISGSLNGAYRFRFSDTNQAYSVEYIPPVDTDSDGMTDDWELLHGLDPNDPDDADDDPDSDEYTNLQEFQNGTDPHVWNARLTNMSSMSVAGTFNGWDAAAVNMRLINDYTWRYTGAFTHESNVTFKFAANGSWTTNWGDNNQSDFTIPLTNNAGEQTGGDISITDPLHGLYNFTFNEQTLAYSVDRTCDEFCDLVAGVTQVVSVGAPGPVMGYTNAWKAILGGDNDASVPSTFCLARNYGQGRVIMFGHDGIVHDLALYDNRNFMVNVMEWLNNGGGKQVAYTEGHGEWVKGAQLSELASEMSGRGYTFSSIPSTVTVSSLSGKDTLIVGNAWSLIDYTERYAIRDFVSNGGSLLMLGLGWSWSGEPNTYPMAPLAELFQGMWARDGINDPTDQYNGSPIFSAIYPHVIHYSLSEATSFIARAHADYPTTLPSVLETNTLFRNRFLSAQAALMVISRDQGDYGWGRWDLSQFGNILTSDYPSYYSKSNTYDKATEGVMSVARERFIRSWIDSENLYDYQKGVIATNTGLYGEYRDLWADFTVYLMDNGGLDSTQRVAIYDYLGSIHPALHNTRAISATNFLGTTVPAISLSGRYGQVNIFGTKVGASSENPFPNDVPAKNSDIFTIVVAHEINHVVDAYTINNNTNLEARKDELINDAGTNRYHYLRGGDGLGFEHGFFKNNPQEFFASIANQWFTDSARTVELGYRRFTNGIPYPINQAVFFADVYSRGTDESRFYTMDTQGVVSNEVVQLVRDANGHIKVLSSDAATFFFGLDSSGNVTNVNKTDGTGDFDGDGMTDSWELGYKLDPFDISDGVFDPDHDGLTNLQEFQTNTHPFRPDTDFDGFGDAVDPEPTTPAYSQVTLTPSPIGRVVKWTYWGTVYYRYEDYMYWGSPSYETTQGYMKFDVSSIPDNAIIRNVAMIYQSRATNWYSGISPTSEMIALDGLDPVASTNAQILYGAIGTGVALQATTTNEFPFGSRPDKVFDWGPAVEANLSSRLSSDTWSLGFRGGAYSYSMNAFVSNVTVIVSYEPNTDYLSNYSTMTMAGSLNGWNAADNNMVLISNYTWRFESEISNYSGLQLKFAANRAWGTNWGDNDQSQFSPTISGVGESAGANITVNGTLSGVLRVTFNEQTAVYTIELAALADGDSDGMPDDWELLHGLDPNDPDDADGNPDGDAYSNLQEYQNGTDPNVWDPSNSNYSSMCVVGNFNDWNSARTNMSLIADYRWRYDLAVTNYSGLQFKFAANGSWVTNWGENDQLQFDLPISGTGDRDGGNVSLNGTLDGTVRFEFNEGSADYSVTLLPPTDSDSDGMPDYWEDRYGLSKNSGADAGLDPDGDGFTNLQEYQNGTNPLVPDNMDSDYIHMSIASDLNGWNAAANNMRLIDHYTWRWTTGIDAPGGLQFKFAANSVWATNWGDNDVSALAPEPINGYAELEGANIAVDGPLDGTYEFVFNETTLEYSFSRAPIDDFDQDGIPDDWEDSNGFNARDGSDAGLDADADGLTNYREYRNGTNPNDADTDDDGASDFHEVIAGTDAGNPLSFFDAGGVTVSGGVSISWSGVGGRTYTVFYSAGGPGEAGIWEPVPGHTNLTGVSGAMSAEIGMETDVTQRYFKVQVQN
ncbi:MAG: hypothetical protein KJ626_05270 [Verrucomicrobia bacterium]|nr:hypothetical protein [Verrucomicrobiota bacterium]